MVSITNINFYLGNIRPRYHLIRLTFTGNNITIVTNSVKSQRQKSDNSKKLAGVVSKLQSLLLLLVFAKLSNPPTHKDHVYEYNRSCRHSIKTLHISIIKLMHISLISLSIREIGISITFCLNLYICWVFYVH